MGVDATRTVRIDFIAEDQNVGSVLKSVDGRLRDVNGRFVSAGREAELFGETAKRSGQQAASGMGRVVNEAKQVRDSLRSATKSAQSFVKGIKDVGLIGLGFSQVVSLGREAVQVLDELATEALEVQQVSRNLAFGIDAAAESTGGLVDNMTLARNANKAFALGVASDSADFAALAGSAQKIAQAQGVSAQLLVEQAVVGIGRKSAARLDDLGILLDQNKAERIYAESLGRTAKDLTLLEKEEAFQKAALIEIQKAGDRAAASMDGFALTVARGKIELQNAKQEFLGFDDSLGRVRETLRGLTDEQLDRLRFGEVADDASAAGTELNDVLEGWGTNLVEIRGAADELGVSFQELIKGQKELREVQAVESTIKGLETLNQVAIRGLEEQAAEAEYQAKLGEARGDSEKLTNLRIIEGLELRKDAAELQFAQTQSAADEAAVLALSRDIELARAQATSRGRGGSGPSRQDRALVAGEQRIAQLEHEARISGLLAKDARAKAAAEDQAMAAARARLELEQQALEVKRARGAFAREQLANEKAAIAFEIEALDVERRVEARQAERSALAEIASIEQARSSAEANAAARRFEALGNEFAAREVLRQQAEQALLANPPEDEIGRIERMDQLAQLAFEREMDRKRREHDAASARADLAEEQHAAELRRIEERTRKQKAAVDATSRFLSTGQQFASAVIGASIKDEEKRAQAELRARGVMAIATGALEVVRAASSFASFSYVEGALHTAAAALAFTQGGIMLSGNLPGRGSVSSGAPAAAAAPAADRETGEAARIVESIPAVDREPARQPTAQQQGTGNVTNIGEIKVLGAIDDETVEKIRIGLDSVDNGLEEAS